MRPRSLVAIATVSLLVMAACSSDDSSSGQQPTATAVTVETETPPVPPNDPATTAGPTTAAPTTAAPTTAAPTTAAPTTTPIDPAQFAGVYEQPGPFPVGVTTATIGDGIMVEIWYPAAAAAAGDAGIETYDIRDFTAPAIKAILTADIPATYSYPATRDAPVADGAFPIVLNSHGFSGVRVGSSFLTAHLASYGMIVVSPDHPTRDLYHVVAAIQPDVVTDPKDDLLRSLELIVQRGATAGDAFAGHVDAEHVGALGHSAGGGTVLAAGPDERIDGYVSMASGILGDGVGVLPDKPSFFLSGAADGVVDPTLTGEAFAAAPSPSLHWEITGVGHNGFDDFCTFGNGQGIIGIAEASGLGAFLDAQPQFRTLGQDGCLPPAVPVGRTFPMIQHAVTAWFRHLFGVDAQQLGLGVESSDSYAEPVTIEVK